MNGKNNLKGKKGITLIALVVTIVVLIILAGISIGILGGEDGLIKQAKKAKEETEISEEKELLGRVIVQAAGKDVYGNIEEEALQKELDKEAGEGKIEVTDIGEEFEVIFKEKDRYYIVDKDGNIGDTQKIIEDKNPGDITKDKDGNELDGSEEKPYEIWCIEDLVVFSNMVNGEGIKFENGNSVEITLSDDFSGKYIKLMRTLNFKSKLSYANSERIDFGDINGNSADGNTLINEMTTGTGFKPIGVENSFAGNFNGENNKINNIYIQSSSYAGLFGKITRGDFYIKNIEISGSIKGEYHTGGIIGEINGSTTANISNCINRANIEGKNEVGGIIGYNLTNNSTIIQCINYGEIKINGWSCYYPGIGGILGTNGSKNCEIKECENYGKIGIQDSTIYTGGIIGTINSTMEISNCANFGEVISNSNSGGIVGYYRFGDKVKIYNNYNQGNIKGKEIGGIIGWCSFPAYSDIGTCEIDNCYNVGELQATGIVGGIVGKIGGYAYEDMKIYMNNCYNIGKLSGVTIGGAVGSIINNGHGEKKQYLYVNNVYYLIIISDKGIGKGNTDEGQINVIENVNSEFVNLLNNYINSEGVYPTEWKKWKLGEDGYPIFE